MMANAGSMIRAVLVDDEKHALLALQDVLRQIDHIEVAGTFTNPFEAITFCEQHEVDAVFLDIEMPGIKGLDAADRIQEMCHAEIVFVTAYDHYAVEAFERYAVDYLLKPVVKQRILKTVERLISRKRVLEHTSHVQEHSKSCFIRCFGRFEVLVRSGQEETLSFKWRMSKAKELFAFLVHQHEKVVHKSRIIEQIWPEIDGEKAIAYLHSCVYQVRKQIKDHQLERMLRLNLIDDGYQLQFLSGVECDVDHFVQLTQHLSKTTHKDVAALEQAVEIYTGDYLEYEGYLWAMDERSKYEGMAQELLETLASIYRDEGEDRRMMLTLQRLLASHPYHDNYHEMLLETYARMGDWEAFVKHYQETEKVYREGLGVDLPHALKILYRKIRQQI